MARRHVFSLLFVVTSLTLLGCAEYDTVEAHNAEIVDNLLAAGISASDIEIREGAFVDEEFRLGTSELVFIDGDTHITLNASRELLEMAGENDDPASKHWRTPGLVNNNTTICLAKVTTASSPYTSYALTSAMETGVNRARTNFNNLSSFNLTMKIGNASLSSSGQLSHSISGCNYTIFIYQVSGGAGGSAGFPSGGAPNNQVRLNSGLAGYSLDAHEHVATHEIGHSIGLRHSDWKTRASCGESTNEGQSGAVQIAGTANQTTNSLMAACFSSSTNGEFRGEDAEAFNAIY